MICKLGMRCSKLICSNSLCHIVSKCRLLYVRVWVWYQICVQQLLAAGTVPGLCRDCTCTQLVFNNSLMTLKKTFAPNIIFNKSSVTQFPRLPAHRRCVVLISVVIDPQSLVTLLSPRCGHYHRIASMLWTARILDKCCKWLSEACDRCYVSCPRMCQI